MCHIELYIPQKEDLWYRQKMMEDPKTMDYNKGYFLESENYNNDTGCILFPKEDWEDWYAYFINNEPKRYYAYILRKEDQTFLGEVCLRKMDKINEYEMGIVIESIHRKNGYSKVALKLLLEIAFEKFHAEAVHNFFEEERAAALHLHLNVGFSILNKKEHIVHLILTKEQYFKQNKSML
ncbi:MAG: GNAT family N-acetyltransferase [Anaeroplasmataceae bacterium]|nr:GNAT family N-acetyltransferase [Anaeroplasmataceae bacterium]MDE6414584.1 GNAT family N-acetyltransferase [Anaeroplasmataceae bacterium]